MTDPGERLDELYREAPERFVAARNELARELREAGEREEADRVKKLKRPTVAAWLVNRLALAERSALDELLEAIGALEEAQDRALAGDDDDASAAFRDAAGRVQNAIRSAVAAAADSVREAGAKPSGKALELAEDTLRASVADPELRERIAAGRLERESTGAGAGIPAPPASAGKAKGKGKSKAKDAAKRRAAERAKRELEKLESQLAEERERVKRLADLVADSEAELERRRSKLEAEREKLAATEERVAEARMAARKR